LNVSDIIKFNDRQKEAFQYIGKGKKIFYGGARGGGKSYFARAAAILTASQFPGISIVFIRETFDELNANFILKIQEEYDAGLWKYRMHQKEKVMKFQNGSMIHFRAMQRYTDANKIQGLEYQFMIVDEAPNVALSLLQKLFGSLRSARDDGFIPTVLMTGNPGGGNDKWFQVRFVNPDFSYWTEFELKHKDKYVFVPATVYDNLHVTPQYIEELETLPEHLREAWLNGRWDIFAGQFFDEFNSEHHVVPTFAIPQHWTRACGVDLGFTDKHPTVCLWAAQDPEDLTVYIYREYTGGKSGSTELYATDIRHQTANENIFGYYLDPMMFALQKRDTTDAISPSQIFENSGVMPLYKANNNRVFGWDILKQWLHWRANTPSKLKIMDCCTFLIESIPEQIYVKEGETKSRDLDSSRNDDAVDALRYLMVSGGFEYPTDAVMQQVYKSRAKGQTKTHTREEIQKRFVGLDSECYIAEDNGLYPISTESRYGDSKTNKSIRISRY